MAISVEAFRKSFEQNTTSKRRIGITLVDGENPIRILPPSLAAATPGVEVPQICVEYLRHFDVGPTGKQTSIVCPRSFGKYNKCPICTRMFELFATRDPQDKALASSIGPKSKYLFNVIDLKNKEAGIQVLEVGKVVFERIKHYFVGGKWNNMFDLEKGNNSVIIKKSNPNQRKNVDYDWIPDPAASSIMSDLPTTWKEDLDKLQKIVPQAPAFDEILRLMEDGVDRSDSSQLTSLQSVQSQQQAQGVSSNAPITQEESKITTPELPKKETTPFAEKPSCFSLEYSSKQEKCITCGVKASCREEFLSKI